MTLQLGEGDAFAVDYSLISCLQRRENAEVWLALDKSSGERIVLKIFDGGLAEPMRARVEAAVTATRGLVHPNIARIYSIGHEDGNDFLVSQYVRRAQVLDPKLRTSDELSSRWPIIEEIIDAITYAHGLSLAHGHLHPGNLLLDEQGRLSITDFGLPPTLQRDEDFKDFISPQVASDSAPDPSDDIFSLGQLLAVMLTGKSWREGEAFEPTSPVPEEFSQLVTSMLSQSAYDRPRDMAVIKESVRRLMQGETDAPIEALGEFRRASSPAPTKGADAKVNEIHRLPRERQVISATVAFGGLAALVVIALAVFLLLPDDATTTPRTADATPAATEQPQQGTAASAQPANQPPMLTPLERARLEQIEERGSELAREILRLQVELEDSGVQLWGQSDFNAAVDRTSEADEAYRREEFETALALYEEAKASLEALQASIEGIRIDNIAAGDRAIEARDAAAAILAYSIVTAIDPEDEAAEAALALAENLDILVDRLDEARYLEDERQLDQARDILRSALALESDWQPAVSALARVERKINQRRFNDAMSAALTALSEKKFETARERFEAAAKILPESPEPADGLQQVEVGITRQQISALREQAQDHEAAEAWQAAIETYDEILAIDSTLIFATEGRARAEARLDLDERISRFVTGPTLLSADEELRAARRTLAEAAAIDENNDQLREQVDKLAHHISVARIPVEVELRSDNRTEVTVYRYGTLGRIESTSIELIPGQYTIVGKRRGFRDAEYELTLLGGRDIPPIYIACTEEI